MYRADPQTSRIGTHHVADCGNSLWSSPPFAETDGALRRQSSSGRPYCASAASNWFLTIAVASGWRPNSYHPMCLRQMVPGIGLTDSSGSSSQAACRRRGTIETPTFCRTRSAIAAIEFISSTGLTSTRRRRKRLITCLPVRDAASKPMNG
ncbi:hypothetical protein X961_4896 [Burkholderia pseudomallei MSHR5613]|nr:hypothetical protein X961_4896 [Burkholderia pseudomallei MSHR5613]